MAEENDQEKTLPASERRLEQAREDGHIPRSRELSGALVLGAAAGLFLMAGEGFSRDMSRLLVDGLTFDRASLDLPHAALERFGRLSASGFLSTLPWLGALTLVALAAPLAIGSWNFSTQALMPQASRIDPLAGIGKLLSTQSLVELGKTLAKALLVGGIGACVIWQGQDAYLGLANESTPGAIAHFASLAAKAFLVLSASLLAIAAIDVPVQLWRYYQGLRMTPEEAKRESRESEGDPMVRGRIRSLQRERARRRMMEEVPKADVVVVNPTHYAVALAWKPESMRAPLVVAKGSELVAAKIRELATEHRVPIVEAPPLARALHRHAEIGAEVPGALYQAVAQVLAYVFQLRRWNGRGAAPATPASIEVPAGFDPLAPAEPA